MPCSSCCRSAIGLSAGIGAVELAAVISDRLQLRFVDLWLTEYGERKGMKRYMSDFEVDRMPAPRRADAAAPGAAAPPAADTGAESR